MIQSSRLRNARCCGARCRDTLRRVLRIFVPLDPQSAPDRALDAIPPGLFKGNCAKTCLPPEPATAVPRLICCMKRILLLSVVLLGAVSASQAGVRLSIGIGVPLPGFVISQPAPVVVAPPPVCVAPPAVVVAPPVILAPAPVYFGCRPGWYGYRGWEHRRDWHHRW